MKAPVSWIREYVDLPDDVSADELARRLTMLGLKLEAVVTAGEGISGPLVVGRVLTIDKEPQKNGKVIRWCTVDVGDANGTGEPQGIVCGADNFAEGDLVVVVLPGGVLPGGFEISARKTYGHVSAGMICSGKELGVSSDSEGIIVLPPDAGSPGDDARPLLGFGDSVIEFEINPDRAYALSLRGIAREAALGFDATFVDPERPDDYRWTWCGRFSIPLGLLALERAARGFGGATGHAIAYETSIGAPQVDRRDVGMTPEAPSNLWHFVGYPGVAFTVGAHRMIPESLMTPETTGSSRR